MLVSTCSSPDGRAGLALFCGGLVRAKNMLSVLMQVLVVFSLIWCCGPRTAYSLAFVGGNAVIGSLDKLFLAGVTKVVSPMHLHRHGEAAEYVFIAFQATFAAITCALIVGSLAERVKFSAVLLFSVLWFTCLPIARTWCGAQAATSSARRAGFRRWHRSAHQRWRGRPRGTYFLGEAHGPGQRKMAPHNLPLTMTGASLLWVGWFGFNAGSNLEATSGAALAFINADGHRRRIAVLVGAGSPAAEGLHAGRGLGRRRGPGGVSPRPAARSASWAPSSSASSPA